MRGTVGGTVQAVVTGVVALLLVVLVGLGVALAVRGLQHVGLLTEVYTLSYRDTVVYHALSVAVLCVTRTVVRMLMR